MENTINIPVLLENLKIKQLNEMQHSVIDAVNEHDEVIVLANTGSGKTLAFLLPIIQRLDSDKKYPQALIMVPSRELALQIDEVFRKMGTSYKVTFARNPCPSAKSKLFFSLMSSTRPQWVLTLSSLSSFTTSSTTVNFFLILSASRNWV